MKQYAVLMMDLQHSRGLPVAVRQQLQQYLAGVMDALNALFEKKLEHRVDFSAGDEVQGLFADSQAAYLYLRWFRLLLQPVRVHAGLGVGEWSIQLEGGRTAAQDGPAYHKARQALEAAKGEAGYSSLLLSGRPEDALVNAGINLMETLEDRHSARQGLVVLLHEMLYPMGFEQPMKAAFLQQLAALLVKRDQIFASALTQRKTRPGDARSFAEALLQVHQAGTAEATSPKDGFYLTGGKQRGAAQRLADILGVSRQSVDSMMGAAAIPALRNGVMALLWLLGRMAEEGGPGAC